LWNQRELPLIPAWPKRESGRWPPGAIGGRISGSGPSIFYVEQPNPLRRRWEALGGVF
jgi:homoserine kinase